MGLFTKTKVKDPVCGMQIEKSKAAGSTPYSGRTYHFCSASCQGKFEASPRDFAS